MEMTIDEARQVLISGDPYSYKFSMAIVMAIDTMRNYQKIEQIVEHWSCCGNPVDSMIAISEVLVDGNVD